MIIMHVILLCFAANVSFFINALDGPPESRPSAILAHVHAQTASQGWGQLINEKITFITDVRNWSSAQIIWGEVFSCFGEVSGLVGVSASPAFFWCCPSVGGAIAGTTTVGCCCCIAGMLCLTCHERLHEENKRRHE